MTRQMRRTVIVTAVAIVALLSVSMSTALAAWSAAASGAGAAAAGAMPDGPDAVGVFDGSDVVVSWTGVALSGGTVADYVVKRYAGTNPVTPNDGCEAVITGEQCTEADTPEGRWTYAVTVAKGSWRGTEGAKSAEVHVPTFAPTNLAAGAATRTSVSLSWSDNSLIEDGYRVQRRDGGDWVAVGDLLAADDTSTVDTTITCGVTRTYRVLATSAANGDSPPSNELEATAAACPQAEAQPTDLSATAVSTTQIDLAWTDNAATESGYRIEWSLDNATWTAFTPDLAAGSESYQDTSLTCGVTRHYRVLALGEVNSAYSDTASATASACAGPPAAPSNLTGQGVSATTISLAWTDNASNETGFVVERSNNANFPGGSVTTFNVAANATAYQDTTAGPCATQRYYRVRATNLVGQSANSNEILTSTLSCPPAAPAISVTASGLTLNVTWAAVSGATGYKVERFNVATAAWEQIATPTTNSYADPLACGQTRNYRVRSANAGGDSPYSNEASGTTQACPPATAPTLTVSATGFNANLSWTAVTGATGYRVERQNGAGWDLLTSTASTTYTDTIPCAQARTYRVRAYNLGGDGPNSNTASATSAACPKATRVEFVPLAPNKNTVGRVDTGEQVVLTYDAVMSTASFCQNWDGTLAGGNEVTVTITNAATNDVLTVSTPTCVFKLGSVAMGGDYVSATATFVGSGNSKSQLAWNSTAKTLTVTFGGLATGTLATASNGTATYTPHADLRDTLDNPIDTTPVSTPNQRL